MSATVGAVAFAGPLAVRAGDVLAARLDEPPDEVVTPGTIGFVVTFFVAVAVVLLVRDMTRRVRRLRRRAEERDAVMARESGEADAGGD